LESVTRSAQTQYRLNVVEVFIGVCALEYCRVGIHKYVNTESCILPLVNERAETYWIWIAMLKV